MSHHFKRLCKVKCLDHNLILQLAWPYDLITEQNPYSNLLQGWFTMWRQSIQPNSLDSFLLSRKEPTFSKRLRWKRSSRLRRVLTKAGPSSMHMRRLSPTEPGGPGTCDVEPYVGARWRKRVRSVAPGGTWRLLFWRRGIERWGRRRPTGGTHPAVNRSNSLVVH